MRQYFVSDNKAAGKIFPICILGTQSSSFLCIWGTSYDKIKMDWLCFSQPSVWSLKFQAKLAFWQETGRVQIASPKRSFLSRAIFMKTQKLIFLYWKEIILGKPNFPSAYQTLQAIHFQPQKDCNFTILKGHPQGWTPSHYPSLFQGQGPRGKKVKKDIAKRQKLWNQVGFKDHDVVWLHLNC